MEDMIANGSLEAVRVSCRKRSSLVWFWFSLVCCDLCWSGLVVGPVLFRLVSGGLVCFRGVKLSCPGW